MEQPAIKVLPLSLAKGELGHHYRFGWLEGNNGKIINGAGREALEKKGWWRSHRWDAGVTSPLSVLRAGDVFERSMVWCGILHGNYSSSLLFDTVPLTDPLMTLQSLASGHLPATVALTGAVIITVLYALAGKRLFCSWVCPLNPINRISELVRRR